MRCFIKHSQCYRTEHKQILDLEILKTFLPCILSRNVLRPYKDIDLHSLSNSINLFNVWLPLIDGHIAFVRVTVGTQASESSLRQYSTMQTASIVSPCFRSPPAVLCKFGDMIEENILYALACYCIMFLKPTWFLLRIFICHREKIILLSIIWLYFQIDL